LPWIISGIFFLIVLGSIHYAASIQILNILTNGESYIQPPVIVVTYAELDSSNIGDGTIIQVRK
jgi:hypothetical protein